MVENLKVGYNFNSELMDFLIEQNNIYSKSKIYEVYGSRKESSFLTARPQYRIPEVSRGEFKTQIEKLQRNGINFNYTLNTSSLGNKKNIFNNKKKIQDYIKFLIDCDVRTITVTLPIIAEFVRELSDGINIEISTIANVDSVTQVKLWKEYYNINKVCGSLSKNRDIAFLEEMANYCNKNEITLSLLANEFCINGTYDNSVCSYTNCIYRTHCYQLHSLDYDENEKYFNNYPMQRCTTSRNNTKAWLKSNFIRPEDMCLYNQIGINHFKLTGRTGSTAYIKQIVDAYMRQHYKGNLLTLWKHLETINGEEDSSFEPTFYIPNERLDGFLAFWFKNKEHRCSTKICGETCTYCDEFYKNHI